MRWPAHRQRPMQFWIIQTLNSLALGGLLFLLSSGFSLIFGLMRIANLTHGALFMLGAYVGVTMLKVVPNLWLAALLGGLVGRRVRRPGRALHPAAARRQRRSARCWSRSASRSSSPTSA